MLTIEQDKTTKQWCVLEYRRGSRIVHCRYDYASEAHEFAQSLVDDRRWWNSNRD